MLGIACEARVRFLQLSHACSFSLRETVGNTMRALSLVSAETVERWETGTHVDSLIRNS